MKKNVLKWICCTIVLSLIASNSVLAQRHLFKRLDLSTDNAYTWIMAVTASTIVNVATESPLVEPTWNWGIVSYDRDMKLYNTFDSDNDNNSEEASTPEALNPTAHNLWSNISAGGKIGYISDFRGSVNYALYGSAHYNFRQLKAGFDLANQKTSRFQYGGGVLLSFGSIESSTRFIIDCGLRYNIPLSYKGSIDGSYKNVLNKGFTSHYSVKLSFGNVGGTSLAMGLGFNCMHYNLFKDESLVGNKSKIHEIALTIMLFGASDLKWR